MRDGFTFLEMIIALGIITILALIAIPQFQSLIAGQAHQQEIQQLVRGIVLARQHAILQGQTVSLCPYQNDDTCGLDWSQGFRVFYEDTMLTRVRFSQGANITLSTFPAGSEYLLQFSAVGFTKTQNGSFYYTPRDGSNMERIVFNQAGRVYIDE
jgi:prepilin-type N-terminal cleavage/methylation domain-containing protein